MRYFIIFLIFLVSIFLEATVVRLPFAFLALLSLAVFFQTQVVFFVALGIGLVLDSLLFRILGQTSLFYIVFLLLIFLYSRKFELRTLSFILAFSFFGSLWYLLLFGHQLFFIQLPVCVGIGALYYFLFFWIENRFQKTKHPAYKT